LKKENKKKEKVIVAVEKNKEKEILKKQSKIEVITPTTPLKLETAIPSKLDSSSPSLKIESPKETHHSKEDHDDDEFHHKLQESKKMLSLHKLRMFQLVNQLSQKEICLKLKI